MGKKLECIRLVAARRSFFLGLLLLAVIGATPSRLITGATACPTSAILLKPASRIGGARTILTHDQLFADNTPKEPLDDGGFAMPAGAAEPGQNFEGLLTLDDVATNGNFQLLADVFHLIPERDSIWKHLAPFHFQFVQSGHYLIPVRQGLVITASPVWNYIVGPGRVWQEDGDQGYSRASFPFALIQRNQNCVHNGEMTFLFRGTVDSPAANATNIASAPNISNVYYQITQETCYPMRFNLWGVVPARYTPQTVANADQIKAGYASELAHRLPSKPFSELSKDFPDSKINLDAFESAYRNPDNITTYGLVLHGINYISGCPTRYGQYAFCSDMRLPSYSIAKSVFAGVALMRLGHLYGSGIYDEKIKDYVPQFTSGGRWDATTFNNVSDMATGNYNLAGYEADEDSLTMDKFLVDEAYDAKIVDAFQFKKHYATPGTKWIYQSAATFVLTQAMTAYMKQRSANGGETKEDIFTLVRDDIYRPLNFSAGALTTIRADDNPDGAPSGYYGLFFNQDDIAKIGNFLNNGKGMIEGRQVLEPSRLQEALFRGPNASTTGVPILGESPASLLGAPSLGKAVPKNARRYSHGFWGRHVTSTEFPEYPCDFWASFNAGYGGDIVMLLPDGATFYIFSDGMEFPWAPAVQEINKIAPMCGGNAHASSNASAY
jgi:Beta-lactamase